MSILQGFFVGVGAYREAGKILFSRDFRWFLLFPLLVLILLFAGGEWLVGMAGDRLSEVVQAKTTGWVGDIAWLHWIEGATGFFVRVLLKIAYFFLFMTLGGYIVLIVMSPIYSWLSERTEAHLSGKQYPFSFLQLLREIMRGIMVAFRNLFFQLLITLLLFICSFIPVIGLVSPFALFLTSAYFYGFSFVDYAIERKKFGVKQSVRYINKNVGAVVGVGAVFSFSLMIPWISMLVCSFVSLLSVIAGTVVVSREEKYGV